MTPTPSNERMRHAAVLLHQVATEFTAAGATADDVLTDWLHDVPVALRDALDAVVELPDRTSGWRVLSGLLNEFGAPGPTPEHWRKASSRLTDALDVALVLLAGAIGRVFGWEGQQDGRLVHNIVPSKGYEHLQVGASSTTPLAWHTEDAFHPHRAELIMLACVRNDDRIGSEVSSVRRIGLTGPELDVLSRPGLRIAPDDSYPELSTPDGSEQAGIPTVWNAEDGPCLRYDPSYTTFLGEDEELRAVHSTLDRRLTACREVVPVVAGDVLLIDNDIAVHGRAAFEPRYDGTDRWLKRTLVRLPRSRPEAEAAEHGFGQLLVGPQPAPEVRS